MPNFKHELGVEAKDKITGFSGIITGRVEYLTGCNQYCVTPKVVNGELLDSHYIDEDRLEVITKKKAIEPEQVTGKKTGGPDRGAPRK